MVTLEGGATYFVYVKPVNAPFSTRRLGTCITIYNNRSIQSMMENVDLTEGTVLHLYNSDGTIIASSDYASLNTKLPEEMAHCVSGEFWECGGQPCLIEVYPVLDREWELICMIPRNEILKAMFSYTYFGLAMIVITVIVVISLGAMLWRNIAYPIRNLVMQMDREKQSLNRHIRIRVDLETKNEIYKIANQFNRLLEEIEELNDRILKTQVSLYESKVLQQEAEIYALQNQINPHFLYNTLDCIRDISIMYRAREIGDISISMANMFRYCVVRQETVSVKAELECVRNYLNIIQIRYRNRFEIRQETDEGIPEEKMPKFILQPVIENAVCHGLERKAGKGLLKLTVQYTEGGEICFGVYDTGAGMSAERLQAIRERLDRGTGPDRTEKHGGIGLSNIQARIHSLYGEGYGITVDSAEREWTFVRVVIPRSAEEQGDEGSSGLRKSSGFDGNPGS